MPLLPLRSTVLLASLFAATSAPSQSDETGPASRPSPSPSDPTLREFVLKNGLEVALRSAPKAKTASVVLLFRVGERHDPPGRSGLAHMAEHLFVTAAAGSIPARDYAAWAAAHPNYGVNAQTASDATFIGVTCEPDALDAELDDFAARLIALRPTESDLERERPRLKAEVANMYGGIPRFAAPNLARIGLAPLQSGGRPGGVDATFDETTLDALRDRLSKLYRANNARLAVVGPFDLDAIEAAIRQKFEPAPRGDAPPAAAERPASRPAELRVERVPRATVESVGQPPTTVVAIAFAPPHAHEPDFPAYLAALLAMVRTDYAVNLVDDKPWTLFAPLDDPETCAVFVGVRDGETPEAAVARLHEWIAERVGSLRARHVRDATSLVRNLVDAGRGPAMIARNNPYGAALSLARMPRAETGKAIAAALKNADEAAFRAVAARIFAADRGSAAAIVVE
jgi:zinc protease